MNRVIDSLNQTPVGVKAGMDISAVGLAWGSLFIEALPVLASGLSVIWLGLQIYAFIVNKKWRK